MTIDQGFAYQAKDHGKKKSYTCTVLPMKTYFVLQLL